MAQITITLDDETGRLDLAMEGFNIFEALGILSIAKDQLICTHSGGDVIDEITEVDKTILPINKKKRFDA